MDSNKSILHAVKQYQQIKFGDRLLHFGTEGFRQI